MKRKRKMARTKNRIKKMTFQKQNRRYVPLSENDKYIIETAGYKKELMKERISNEDIQRIARGGLRP
jgi:hypothetical protein